MASSNVSKLVFKQIIFKFNMFKIAFFFSFLITKKKTDLSGTDPFHSNVILSVRPLYPQFLATPLECCCARTQSIQFMDFYYLVSRSDKCAFRSSSTGRFLQPNEECKKSPSQTLLFILFFYIYSCRIIPHRRGGYIALFLAKKKLQSPTKPCFCFCFRVY